MRKSNVYISQEIIDDLDFIAECVYFVSCSNIIADRYIEGIRSTIFDLANYGTSVAFCTNSSIVAKYGPFVKRINYKKVAIIYAVAGNDIYILELVFQHSITDI